MPSTFTENTGIELIADGEQTGAWGQRTNDNFNIIDRALNGSVNIALSGTTGTVTTGQGSTTGPNTFGQFAVLVFTGSPSGTNTVTIEPNTAQKTYVVRNTTAEDIVLTQGSGGNVTVPAGRSAVVSSNGGGASAAVVDLSAGLVPVLTNAGVTATTAELNILDGVTATTAELNILDGVTATTAELNILDGVTATTAELNILDGVTATTAELNILDGVTATTAELNILDGVTATAAELNILDGVTATAAELNILDGVTATAAELNILDGVTATTAELNILDGVTATTAELNLVDGSVAGTIVNSKTVVYGAAGQVNATTLQIAGTSITSTAAELNILDGVTATTAELNILDGVTATTAELNILDGVTATAAELNVLDGIAGIASEAEAEAGTENTKLMTALRTKQAIDALAALAATGDVDGLFSGAVAGTVTLFSALGTDATFTTSPPADVLGARFRAITSGTVRVSFEMRSSSGDGVNVTVQKNGVTALSQARTLSSFATFTVDVSFIAGDTINVRAAGGEAPAGNFSVIVRNVRFQTSSARLLGGV